MHSCVGRTQKHPFGKVVDAIIPPQNTFARKSVSATKNNRKKLEVLEASAEAADPLDVELAKGSLDGLFESVKTDKTDADVVTSSPDPPPIITPPTADDNIGVGAGS